MEFQIPMTEWMWLPDWHDPGEAVLALFRRKLTLEEAPETLPLLISADSRYKLFVNGRLVSVGPSKGDRLLWFYDEVDLAPFLTVGENVIAVEVLRYPPDHKKGNHSVWRTAVPGLYVKEPGGRFGLTAGEGWKCLQDGGFRLVPESMGFVPLYILEDRRGVPGTLGWRLPGCDDSGWQDALCYNHFQMDMAVSPRNLFPRTIPPMRLEPRNFEGVFGASAGTPESARWNEMLHGGAAVSVPARSNCIVELNAGELTTGFLSLRLSGGRGAVIRLLTSEGYVQEESGGWAPPKKADRLDWKNGHLHGFTDTYAVCGGPGEIYEPFWFRTFRFVRLEVTTGEEPLEIAGFDYLETGYPLEARAHVETSDESLLPVWEISLRTLRRCMHETYEDCPFYEQLQYAMDSRSQILYTYMVSADDRLARKCMDDFRRSQRYDGMINCSYPNYGPNIIPGFAIYYILMLHDHMMFFDDKELLRQHMGAVDGILEFFRRSLDERGLVGKVGGVNGSGPYWSFIDWTSQWDGSSGMPTAGLRGPITMESLLYIMGLTHAAEILEHVGRPETAGEYRARAEAVKTAVRRWCLEENGMFTDGPGVKEYSQHCQVFALLTGTADPEQGKAALLETLDHPEKYAQCSVAMAYYLFRALEQAGLYRRTQSCWEIWRNMVKKHLTTCVEDGVRERSDCHAWGALALYELPAVTLGVRPAAPGFAKVRIAPVPGYMTWAEGTAATPRGDIHVSWKLDETGKPVVEYRVPEGVEVLRE